LAWSNYAAILRRRWTVVVVIVVVDLLVSGVLYARSAKRAGFVACQTLYVADVSAPSIVSAPDATLQGEGQLLSGESAANFFADDVLDVSQSRNVAQFASRRLSRLRLASSRLGDIMGSVTGSRRDRTVDICVSNPSQTSALAISSVIGQAMTQNRALFMGKSIARRTFVMTVSNPTATPAPVSSGRLSLALRVFLGLLIALGFALLWDAVDPRVRDRRDVEQTLGAPVLYIVA